MSKIRHKVGLEGLTAFPLIPEMCLFYLGDDMVKYSRGTNPKSHKIINLTNRKFYRWKVIRLAYMKNHTAHWVCRCDCGAERVVICASLTRNKSKSCGCLQREMVGRLNLRHGKSQTKIYSSWEGMIARCTNKNHKGYKYYGGRGIKVCKRWRAFKTFYDDMGDKPKGLTLERINNDGNYEPSNCKWATRAEQRNNRRKAIVNIKNRKRDKAGRFV